MRLLVFLLFLGLIDFYAFQAFKTISHSWSRLPKASMLGFYLVLSLGAYLYVIGSSSHWIEHWNKNLNIYLRAVVFILFFSKFVVGLFMGIDDLRRLVLFVLNQFSPAQAHDLGRSRFLTQIGLLAGSIPFVSLTYGMLRNQYRYKVYRNQLKISQLPSSLDGLRIIQISDIHSGSFTFKDPIRNGIEMINALEPDLVFFTGDLVNSQSVEMEPYLDVFDKIKAKYGVFSILGNHDYGDYRSWPTHDDKVANFENLKSIHKKLGWDLLLNENRILEINGTKLAVLGVENISAMSRFITYGDLKKASEGTEEADFSILLSHDPTHWASEVVTSFPNVPLTLSGHTHGFQFGIEIPGWIKWSPSKYVYKHWAGAYSEGDQHLYVNRGFGVLGYPGRVGILPEISLLELKSVS